MDLFDPILGEIREYIEQRRRAGPVRPMRAAERSVPWPAAGKSDLVMSADLGVELGHPQDGSTSFLVWTDTPGLVLDGQMTLIGPDIGEADPGRLPYGKAVLIGGTGFTEENCYDRYREMEGVRYDLSLKGFMMRAVSQYRREWVRVSREALRGGFSFAVLGGALRAAYREKPYVSAVEMLLVTRSREDVADLGGIGERAMTCVNAMRKMTEEESLDCDSCEYQDVCSEATLLVRMREKLVKNRGLAAAGRDGAVG